MRKPRLEDAGALFRAYASDRDVVKFLTWKAHETEDETHAFLRHCLDEWANKASYPYVIDLNNGSAGSVGMIHLRDKPHGVGFGYVLAHPHWGRGFMTEALAALVDWSLAQSRVWRAYAFCDLENLASARVMEKAGMASEGILRRYFVHPNLSPEPRDCRMYAKVRS